MLVIAEQLPIPSLRAFRYTCVATFEIRDTTWPPQVAEPPQLWLDAWASFVNDYAITWKTLDDASEALHAFWKPVISSIRIESTWDAQQWKWVE